VISGICKLNFSFDVTNAEGCTRQGHLLTAWAQCWAILKDTTCRDRATSFVAELAKCQANNGAAGFSTGYLSGFPESDFTALENGKLTSGEHSSRTADNRAEPVARKCSILCNTQNPRWSPGCLALDGRLHSSECHSCSRRLGRHSHIQAQ
jgi:hypothetical protein